MSEHTTTVEQALARLRDELQNSDEPACWAVADCIARVLEKQEFGA